MSLLDFNNFIGEGGMYSGDLTSLSIKALERAKKTNAYKILKFIFEAGPEGVKFTEISRFIVEELKGRTYDRVRDRGYYATNLYGSGYGQWRRYGLFDLYCKKLENGKWALNDETKKFFQGEEELYKDLSQKELDLFSKLMKKNK